MSTQDSNSEAHSGKILNSAVVTPKSSKEEVIAAIQACAAKLGRVPSQADLKQEMGVGPKFFVRQFGNYTKALQACGLEGRGGGFMISTEKLFLEWARIVREIGEIPSIAEYALHSKYSLTPLKKRFGDWTDVPTGLVQYAQANGHAEEWADVLELAKKHKRRAKTGGWTTKPVPEWPASRVLKDRPVYGAPLMNTALGFAPVNEMGVVYLFGMLAGKLGFMVTWMGTSYPDCEAIREVEPGRWQRVRIEFEFESRNFMHHFHNPEECDLIVCWEHNWAESPLEVVELRKAISTQ